MSNLTVKGNASGTGTVILEAPNTNSNRTITLPDSTSTLATTAQVDAIESVTLLGTIATTSGSSVTLSGLDLTDYTYLFVQFDNVSMSAMSWNLQLGVGGPSITNGLIVATHTIRGDGVIFLSSGIFRFSSAVNDPTVSSTSSTQTYIGTGAVTSASTSITFAVGSGTLDAGSIHIYGVK